MKALLAKPSDENCRHLCLIWARQGSALARSWRARLPRRRVGCMLETQISSLSDWLQDGALVLSVLNHKCGVFAHCLAGSLLFYLFFFPSLCSLCILSIHIQLCFPLLTCLWTVLHSHACTHSHPNLSPTVAYFPKSVCMLPLYNGSFCRLRRPLQSLLSHSPSHSFFNCLSPSPSPPSALLAYSFPFTAPLSSIFLHLGCLTFHYNIHPTSTPHHLGKSNQKYAVFV